MSIDPIDHNRCCGCNLCGDVCPKAAIQFHPNEEGFLCPDIDPLLCISCGLCKKLCPQNTEAGITLRNSSEETKASITAWGCLNKDLSARKTSSSGGVFSLLAEKCILSGGIVYGAAFDEQWRVVHMGISDLDDLHKIRGSKYVQSDLRGIYSSVKSDLKSGKPVLFSGVPCQVAALKNYLGKDYDNLLCVDLFCHGIGSLGLFEQYLNETIGDKFQIQSISFRDKTKSWEKYNMRISAGKKVYLKKYQKDPYLWSFCQQTALRESCYRRRAKGFPKKSDITLGDLWTVDRVFPEINDHMGVSIVLTHTKKGSDWLMKINEGLQIRRIEQPRFLDLYQRSGAPGVRPKQRDVFFKTAKNTSVTKAAQMHCKESLKYRFVRFLRNMMIKIRIYEYARKLKQFVFAIGNSKVSTFNCNMSEKYASKFGG